MTTRRPLISTAILALIFSLAISQSAFAQRGGRGGGGGIAPAAPPQSRLDILESSFKLNKTQRKAVKQIMDDAHERAAAAREGLARARAALTA